MSADRIEGAVWHPLPTMTKTTDSENGAMRFSQLMSPSSAGAHRLSNKRMLLHDRHQRYRLVGGHAEGVVCEVGERDGEVCLTVLVPHYQLFTTLTQLSSWLGARLRESGHSLVLAVEYVGSDVLAEQDAHEEHAEHGKAIHDKPRCRGVQSDETPSS